MLGVIGERLQSAERQRIHFDGLNNPSVLANLSQIYQDTPIDLSVSHSGIGRR